jgi:hypothetical protein
MAYSITLSDGTPITVDDGLILNTYSVPIIGQNAPNYGDDVAIAHLRQLENFAASTDPASNPNIAGSVNLEGQLWYNKTANQLNVYNGTTWDSVLTLASDFNGVQTSILPDVDSTNDLGGNAQRFLNTYTDNLIYGGTVTAEGSSNFNLAGTFTADGGSTVDLNGTVTIAGATMDGLLILQAPTTSASIRLPEGAPTPTPTTTGDMWLETDGVHVIINGTERTLAVAGGAGSSVSSFNTRSGDVTPLEADYSAFYAQKTSGSTVTIHSASVWDFDNSPAFDNIAPFTVTNPSAGTVTNLDADKLDGQQGTYYAPASTVVNLTDAQPSIGGTKTFTSTINADTGAVSGEGLRIRGTSPSSSSNLAFISFYESDNATLVGKIGRIQTSNSNFDIAADQSSVMDFRVADNIYNNPVFSLDTGGAYVKSVSSGAIWIDMSLAGTGENGALRFLDQGGTLRNAGFNETPTVTVSGTFVVNSTHVGKFLTRTSDITTNIRLDNALNNFPVGASFMVHNDFSAASTTMQVTQNGTTLEWVDGSGSAPITGNRTIAYNGVATVRKKSTGVYQFWGNGIS